MQFNKKAVFFTASHARMRISSYYKSRENPYQVMRAASERAKVRMIKSLSP